MSRLVLIPVLDDSFYDEFVFKFMVHYQRYRINEQIVPVTVNYEPEHSLYVLLYVKICQV